MNFKARKYDDPISAADKDGNIFQLVKYPPRPHSLFTLFSISTPA